MSNLDIEDGILEEMNDTELDELVERIEKEKLKRLNNLQVLDEIDVDSIVDSAKGVHEASVQGHEQELNYLYEAVMEAVYGSDYFDKLNEITD